MAVKHQTITVNNNHANVGMLRGWSLRGTFVINFREAVVGGDIIGSVSNTSYEMFGDAIIADGGVYVEVVSGSLTQGTLYYN